MLPSKVQSRYRGHLFDFKPLFQLPLARRSLNQSSRFTYSPPCKNFTSVRFNLGMMCLKQISSHFTIASHKEDFGDGDKSFPSLARFLVLAKARIVPDDPSLVLPFGYIFIREKLQNFARVYTRNKRTETLKSYTKTRASSFSLYIPAFCAKESLFECFSFDLACV